MSIRSEAFPVPQGDHGGDVQQIARLLRIDPADVLDFSNNAFVQARDITAEAIQAVDPEFDRYPDPDCVDLRLAIARHESCSPDEILPGNGSAELIWLALAAVRPRRVLLVGPAFSEYRRACEGLAIPYTLLPPPEGQVQWWPRMRPDSLADVDCAILCSPNNPGGHTCPDLAACLAALDCPTVLLDLAYRDFLGPGPLRDSHTWAQLKALPQRLICLHSLTKFFCCAGIRVGYLTADPDTLAEMRRKRAAWMVNAFAANAAIALLRRFPDYCARLPQLARDKAALRSVLHECGLFSEILDGPSFLIARVQQGSAAALRAALAARRILIRDCDSIPGMPPGYVRLQARSEEDSARLKKALLEFSGTPR